MQLAQIIEENTQNIEIIVKGAVIIIYYYNILDNEISKKLVFVFTNIKKEKKRENKIENKDNFFEFSSPKFKMFFYNFYSRHLDSGIFLFFVLSLFRNIWFLYQREITLFLYININVKQKKRRIKRNKI